MGRNKTFTKKGSRLQESCLNQDLLNVSAQDQMLIQDQNLNQDQKFDLDKFIIKKC